MSTRPIVRLRRPIAIAPATSTRVVHFGSDAGHLPGSVLVGAPPDSPRFGSREVGWRIGGRDSARTRWMRDAACGRSGLLCVAARRLTGARTAARRAVSSSSAFEVVHARSALAALELLAACGRSTAVGNLVVSIGGGEIGRAVVSTDWLRALRRVFDAADVLVVDSELARRLAIGCGAPRERVRVVPTAVELHAIAASGPRAGVATIAAENPRETGTRRGAALRLLACGPLVEREGIQVAIEALACLRGAARAGRSREPNVELRVLGRGPELRALKALARHLEVGSAVRWLGPIDDATLLAELRRCDAFLGPGVIAADGDRDTDLAPATLIAMAAAVPVILRRSHGDREELRDGHDVWMWEARDPADDAATLAERIDALVPGASENRAVGARGRARLEHSRAAVRLAAAWDAAIEGATAQETATARLSRVATSS